jgi:protein-disulfide isomerase
MSNTLLRTIAATTVVFACARSDAAPRTKDSSAAASSAASASTPGTPSATAAPHDSITDLADRGRILGDASAPLWVIMASDFQCPFCKQWHDSAFQKIVNSYVKTGRIRLAFLNLPLNIHQHALKAAEAAMCTAVQDKFWPMHEALFARQQDWEALPDPTPTFTSLAAGTGANMNDWQKCMKDHSTLPLIQADRERVTAAHVNSTPTFFVGDQLLAGADAKLADAIDAALAKAKSGKKPAS